MQTPDKTPLLARLAHPGIGIVWRATQNAHVPNQRPGAKHREEGRATREREPPAATRRSRRRRDPEPPDRDPDA